MQADEYKYSDPIGGTALLYYDRENERIENIIHNINPGHEQEFLPWAAERTGLPEFDIYELECFQKILIANNASLTKDTGIGEDDHFPIKEDKVEKRGRSPRTDDEKLEAIRKWRSLNPRFDPRTKEHFLCDHFGTYSDGSPIVPKGTFDSWVRDFRKKGKIK